MLLWEELFRIKFFFSFTLVFFYNSDNATMTTVKDNDSRTK